ncbi:MAG TPA: hypothetical protein VM120_13090 [Bryobacteraceae bacterium]|nr:hypothetical protein [Bryobacteraceae bacterium]
MRPLLLMMAAAGCAAQTRPVVTLENGVASVVIDRQGGSFVRFEFKDQKLNPLVWNDRNPGTAPQAMGHFLCLDRWGQVSEAEAKSGMPYHGEATKVEWKTDNSSRGEARLSAHLPIANLDVTRVAQMSGSNALLTVRESVTNRNKLGRPYNMVQHPTVGPPFLDTSVVVDSNARRGFMQSNPMPHPEEPSVFWPQALQDGQPVNLRHLHNDSKPDVVSYVVEDDYGWVTAANASKGLLIGYVWKTSEYPWLSIWRHVDDQKKPLARGLEFGTTGVHQPFYVLSRMGHIFGKPVMAWIEPGETQTRGYIAFLFKIPAGYSGVAQVIFKDGTLRLKERGAGAASRDLVMTGVKEW